MKLRTLVCFSLFAIAAKAQTKDAEFRKVQDLLKKSNGIATKDFKVMNQTFNEKTIKLEALADGKTMSIVCSDLDWDRFDYTVEKVKDNSNLAEVVILFDEKVDMASYEGKKKLEEDKHDEMHLFINASDTTLMEQQLEQLQMYAWESLNEVRTADKAGLISFITRHLNKALDEEDGKVKSINECSITIAYDDEEFLLPVKKMNMHEKEFLGNQFVCYGKAGALIQTKNSSGTQTKNMEHPDVELDFSYDYDIAIAVKMAVKKLASFCNR